MRIDKIFTSKKTDGKKVLISYIMAGENGIKDTLAQMNSLSKSCDIIEVGFPFSNPVADGLVIQESAIKSLKNYTKIQDIFDLIKEFRKTNQLTAIVLMGYYNIIYKYGEERFAKMCSTAGIDGLIVCDLPIEECTLLYTFLKSVNINLIQLVTNLTSKERMLKIAEYSSGFAYFVSILGVTGSKEPDLTLIKPKLEEFSKIFKCGKVIGFGINTPTLAKRLYEELDGIVIGSHFIKYYNKCCLDCDNPLTMLEKEVERFVY